MNRGEKADGKQPPLVPLGRSLASEQKSQSVQNIASVGMDQMGKKSRPNPSSRASN
jgi:hypothetical protein